MQHIQDLGKFDNETLKMLIKSSVITGDRKAYRKFIEEQERRRRAAVSGIAF